MLRLSLSALLLLVACLVCAIIFGEIAKVITLDPDNSERGPEDSTFATRGLKNQHVNDHRLPPSNRVPDGSADNLIWFLQISDIHISVFHDLSRVSDLREFCSLTLDTIKPHVVLASGDLTDAKAADHMGSRQYIEEWQHYKSVLEECRVREKTLWLDVRGNHDNFNVPSLNSSENYYRNFSVQGSKHLRSYMAQVKHQRETYSFIAVDACLEPGPKRPFNFIGVLGLKEFEQLQEFGRRAEAESHHTIWFGHYPTSCILAPSPGLRPLIGRSGTAYLCGHLHQLLGLVPNMYTLQKSGNLELELGDWMDNRLFRLLAIDHGYMSFVDVPHGDWPIVLPTNPKHALFMVPGRESLPNLQNSSHIRLLAFSTASIISVRARVDEEDWGHCEHVEGPLYVLKWNASKYLKGLHHLTVEVSDEMGRSKTVSQPFALDGTRLNFGFLPRMALMVNASVMFQASFGFMLVLCVLPICSTRFMHRLVRDKRIARPRWRMGWLQRWLRRIWILSTVDRIFVPLTLYAVYLTFGPWAIGELIENHTGVIFAWGTIINGSYLPGSLTYFYGFIHLLVYQLPLTLILADIIDKRFQNLNPYVENPKSGYCRHVPFLLLIVLQVIFAFSFWLAYGTMAVLLGPLRSGSILLGTVLWYQAVNLPEKCFREARYVWDTARSGEQGQ